LSGTGADGPWPTWAGGAGGGRVAGYASGARPKRVPPSPARARDRSNDELRRFLGEAEAEMDRLEAMLRERVLRKRQAGPTGRGRGPGGRKPKETPGGHEVAIRDTQGRTTGYVRVDHTLKSARSRVEGPPDDSHYLDPAVLASLTKHMHMARDVDKSARRARRDYGERAGTGGRRRSGEGDSEAAGGAAVENAGGDAEKSGKGLHWASILIQAYYRGHVVRKKLVAHKERAMIEKAERERYEHNLRLLKGGGGFKGEEDPTMSSDDDSDDEVGDSALRVKLPGQEERSIHSGKEGGRVGQELSPLSESALDRETNPESTRQELLVELETVREELRSAHATVALQLERMKAAEVEILDFVAKNEALQQKLAATEKMPAQEDMITHGKAMARLENLYAKSKALDQTMSQLNADEEGGITERLLGLDTELINHTEAMLIKLENAEAESARLRADLHASEAKLKELGGLLDIKDAEIARCQAERAAAQSELSRLRASGREETEEDT